MTVSLTLTFADLAQAEQAIAAIRATLSPSPASFCVQATAPLPSTSSPKAGATNLAGRDSSNLDSAILTAPVTENPAIAARRTGPTQPKIQKVEEDRAANPKRRPHCMNPSACGSYTARHCYSCRKALGESEAA